MLFTLFKKPRETVEASECECRAQPCQCQPAGPTRRLIVTCYAALITPADEILFFPAAEMPLHKSTACSWSHFELNDVVC